jgi:hypothetical protein
MPNRTDLYIVDAEVDNRGQEFDNLRDFFSEAIGEYARCVNYLSEQLKGDTATSIGKIGQAFGALPQQIDSAGTNVNSDCSGFITTVDSTDGDIY